MMEGIGTEAGTKEGIGMEAGTMAVGKEACMMEVKEVVCLEMEVCISEAGTGVQVEVLEVRTWEKVEIVTGVCSDFCHLQSEEDISDMTSLRCLHLAQRRLLSSADPAASSRSPPPPLTCPAWAPAAAARQTAGTASSWTRYCSFSCHLMSWYISVTGQIFLIQNGHFCVATKLATMVTISHY